MIYIKYTKDYKECFDEKCKMPKLLKKMDFDVKAVFGKFFVKRIPNGELIILPSTNKQTKKHLFKFLKIYNVKTICASKDLNDSNFFEGAQLNILDGKWLYKYLILNYIKFIANQQEKNLQEIEISFLINKITELDLDNIEETAKLVKCVNVVTSSISRAKRLADKLYEGDGIILNVTNNYKKSLIKSNIIINMDYEENELNKFAIPRKAVVINIGNRTKINYKGFDGINVFDYSVIIPSKYLSTELNSFKKEVLYESYLYKNTSPKNIFKEIKNDNIHIESLIGQKGVIRKVEFSQNSTK